MKHLAFVLGAVAMLAAPVFAQQGPPPGPPPAPPNGPPPALQQQLDQTRASARTQAMAALSSDHQAKVSDVLARIKAGQVTDLHDAAQQIDAILSPKESQAVLAARAKMMADLRAAMAGGDGPAPANGPGPGPGAGFGPGPGPGGGFGPGPGPGGGFGPGPGGNGPPGEGQHHRRQAMRNDAGFALLTLSLDHEQMRTLLMSPRPPQ